MKTCKLFLVTFFLCGFYSLNAQVAGTYYYAVDAEPQAHKNEGTNGYISYADIPSPNGGNKGYVMTGYAGLTFYIEIDEAGNYDLSLYGCSGDKNTDKTGALAVDQEHTDVPNVDPGNNRYTVEFKWPYSYDEGAVRKFEKLTFATNYYFTAGEHYIVYDSWDPGTWSHVRIDGLQVEPTGGSSIEELAAPQSSISVADGIVTVTPVSADSYSLNVYAVSGSTVWSQNGLSGASEISGLQKGVYVISIDTPAGRDIQKVVIK